MNKTKQKSKNVVLGLDCGKTAVKALEMVRNGSSLCITNCAIANVKDPSRRSDAVAAALRAGDFRSDSVVIGISGRGTVLRQVSIPGDAADDLDAAVKREAEKLLSYNIDDALLDYHIDPHQHGRNINVLLAAARRTDVEAEMRMLAPAGVVPAVVDMEAAGLANALETMILAGEARPGVPLCLVDFGATKTLIVVSDGGNHLFREFPFGGDKMTEMIAHRLGIEPDEAETVKLDPGERMDVVKDAMYPGIEDLTAEIHSCLERFKKMSGGRAAALTYLSGGLTAFSGVVRLVSRISRIETRIFDPFRVFGSRSLNRNFLDANGHRFSLAFGLACHARE